MFSSRTEKWPAEKRRISAAAFPLPLRLAVLSDPGEFRRQLGRASAALGREQAQKPGGNPTKRLRLMLEWPLAVGKSTRELEDLLAASERAEVAEHGLDASKYGPLGRFLSARTEPEVRLRLSEIADMIQDRLPQEAWTDQFWANAAGHHKSRRRQWLDAGYKARFERRTETVLFRREAEYQPEASTSNPIELEDRVGMAKQKLEALGDELPPPPAGESEPETEPAAVTRYVRNPNVIAWVLLAASGACEACGQKAPFSRPNGEPFLEVHHVRPLAQGGPDQHDNAVATCPNCHRRLHFAADREEFRAFVISRVARIIDYPNTRQD